MDEFEHLSLKCDLVELVENTIAIFMEGFQIAIARVMQLQSYWTLQDVIKLALKVKKQQKIHKPTQAISRDGGMERGYKLRWNIIGRASTSSQVVHATK